MNAARTRAPLGIFHDDEQPRRQRPNLPLEDKAVLLLEELERTLEAIVLAHDDATTDDCQCRCDICDDAHGGLWFLNFLTSAFIGQLKPSPGKLRRMLAGASPEVRAAINADDPMFTNARPTP